jgi:hypothetical protein
MVRQPDATMQPTPQDDHLMSKHRVLCFNRNFDFNGEASTGFLEKPAAPPVDRASSENMLDHAHVKTPVIRARVTVAAQLPSRS